MASSTETPFDYDTPGSKSPVVAVAHEKMTASSSDAGESIDAPRPRLHAKTFLAVGAVCLIYMAQLICIVGAGAVSESYFLFSLPSIKHPQALVVHYLRWKSYM